MSTPEYKVVEWTYQPGLAELANEWASECGLRDFSLTTAMKDMDDMKNRGDSEVFVLLHGSDIVGGLGITILDMFYTEDMFSAVRYWYVKPDHRGAAFKLIVKAKRWSKDMLCKKMMICSNRLCSPSRKFYTALRFKEYETVYIRDL